MSVNANPFGKRYYEVNCLKCGHVQLKWGFADICGDITKGCKHAPINKNQTDLNGVAAVWDERDDG